MPRRRRARERRDEVRGLMLMVLIVSNDTMYDGRNRNPAEQHMSMKIVPRARK